MKPLILILSLALILTAPTGCIQQKKPSALEKLRAKNSKDPVENMRFPEQAGAGKTGGEKPASDTVTGAKSGLEKITPPSKGDKKDIGDDLKQLDKLPAPVVKKAVVTAREAVLRKGPGSQFKEAGMAHKGESFALTRVVENPGQDEKWYVVQDKAGNLLFLSSFFSTISEDKPGDKTKTSLKKSQKTSLEKLESIFDPTPPLPQELVDAKSITLNFEETEIYDVITTFSELLKIDYVIEGAVQGKVTLQTLNKIPVQDLYSVLEQILVLHNLTVVKSGNFYRFVPVKEAAKKPLSVYYGTQAKLPANDRVVIQIIPLKHISEESMKKIISPLLTENARFIEISETRNLMLIELASNVKRILKVVEAIDIDKLASSDIELYPIKHSDASMIASELSEIFSTLGFADALSNSLTFLPLNRLNAILVVNAFPNIESTIEFWLEKLDQPIAQQNQMGTFVYYVQNGEASRMASILNSVFGGPKEKELAKKKQAEAQLGKQPATSATKKTDTKVAAPETPASAAAATGAGKTTITATGAGGLQGTKLLSNEEEIEGKLTVIADKDTNSLIIRVSPRNYPAILELMRKLDLVPQQVLIEVLIMDLTVDEQTTSGFDWAMEGKLENARFATGPDTLKGGFISGLSAATPPIGSGFSFGLANASKLRALVQALTSDAKANVLSNPTLIASDNKMATISVTQEVPIQSTTITTPTAGQPLTQSTVEFKSVGIKLNIDPKINSDNYVSMKIQQEISSTGTSFGAIPSFNVRSINTEVTLKDNQVLVMGGLMQKTQRENSRGIPILKDLPIFGRLFSSQDEAVSKTELMVFVVPHIILNTADADTVTKQMKKRLFDLRREMTGTRDLIQ